MLSLQYVKEAYVNEADDGGTSVTELSTDDEDSVSAAELPSNDGRQSFQSREESGSADDVNPFNLLVGTKYADVPTQRFVQIENNADGDCFYEAVLDAASRSLPPEHALNRLVEDRLDERRPPTRIARQKRPKWHQRALRDELVRHMRTERNAPPAAVRRVERNWTWATTDELQAVADRYGLCIVLHSQPDGTWTVVTPAAGGADDCAEYIVLRNLDDEPVDMGTLPGKHFVALVETSRLRD